MQKTNRYISVVLLAGALTAPVAIIAAPEPQKVGVQVRVYDRNHKDYHNWDDRENHAWSIYLTDNHKKKHEFTRASKKEQSNYWAWRHAHPDKD